MTDCAWPCKSGEILGMREAACLITGKFLSREQLAIRSGTASESRRCDPSAISSVDRERRNLTKNNGDRHGDGGATPMRLNWQDLGSVRADNVNGETIEMRGFAATALPGSSVAHFILTSEPGCCPGCFPRDVTASVEVFAASPIPMRGQSLRLSRRCTAV